MGQMYMVAILAYYMISEIDTPAGATPLHNIWAWYQILVDVIFWPSRYLGLTSYLGGTI